MKKEETGLDIGALVRKVIFLDFIKGLAITLGYTVSRTISLKYPDEEKWVPYKRFRGMHTLNRDEQGRELCVACELCVKACPTNCITVVPMDDNTGRGISDRVAKVWQVEIVRCLFCGYCEDACPTRAVRLGRDYELACTDIRCTIKTKEELLEPQSIPENIQGGFVVKAKFERNGSGIKVRPILTKYKKRRI